MECASGPVGRLPAGWRRHTRKSTFRSLNNAALNRLSMRVTRDRVAFCLRSMLENNSLRSADSRAIKAEAPG